MQNDDDDKLQKSPFMGNVNGNVFMINDFLSCVYLLQECVYVVAWLYHPYYSTHLRNLVLSPSHIKEAKAGKYWAYSIYWYIDVVDCVFGIKHQSVLHIAWHKMCCVCNQKRPLSANCKSTHSRILNLSIKSRVQKKIDNGRQFLFAHKHSVCVL